jgi:hypothetical protein
MIAKEEEAEIMRTMAHPTRLQLGSQAELIGSMSTTVVGTVAATEKSLVTVAKCIGQDHGSNENMIKHQIRCSMDLALCMVTLIRMEEGSQITS